ncbi:hypothetical protein D3C83_50490 [compost metagenome]
MIQQVKQTGRERLERLADDAECGEQELQHPLRIPRDDQEGQEKLAHGAKGDHRACEQHE